MRRSGAPSARKVKAQEKRRAIDDDQVSSTSDLDFGISSWGTKESSTAGTNASTQNSKQNSFMGKMIFNVLWREMSKKKNKTWPGVGTIEIHDRNTSKKAVLKDETGKYVGSSTLFKIDNLDEGKLLVVGGKEVELQSRIKDEKEYWALHKQQMENRAWGEEERQVQEPTEKPTTKVPKGAFVFRPYLVMEAFKMPKTSLDYKNELKRRNFTNAKDEQPSSSWGTSKENCEWSDDTTEPLEKRPKGLPPVKPRQSVEERKDNQKAVVKVEPLVLNIPKDLSTLAKLNTHNRPLQEVRVSPTLVQNLRPHQREGVAFMYACLMGFRQSDNFGCILADEMGLGKTLQCLTAAHTLLQRGPFGGERVLQRVLIVTPSGLTSNWNNEVYKWLNSERMFAFVVDEKHKLAAYKRQQHQPFVVVSYETLLTHAEQFADISFDLLICDEGQRLKNHAAKIYTTLRDLNIQRRLILTGTPVQNNLKEFFALADFVNPGIFGSYQEFRKHFEQPLQQSQCPEASEEIKQLAKERSTELNEISSQFMLRRLQQLNRQYLPKKREYICFVRPTELQQFMLQKALDLYENRKDTILKDLSPLQIITVIKKICNHPSLIGRTKTPNLFTRHLERYLPDWSNMGPFDSGKLELVQHFLTTTAVEQQEKCVLVSNHTKTLNMLQGLCDYLNVKCLRLDGSTPQAERNANVRKFNEEPSSEIERPLVFLLSAKAGGMGLNLIGASRLILYDNDWNPSTDAQAMSRIWRDGQTKDVQIYRLVTAGCIEEKIFQRQVAKISLGECVLQQENGKNTTDSMKFSAEDLQDLFSLQSDFDSCRTHESLKCDCGGDGKNLLDQIGDTKESRQINELMQWQHYGPQFSDDFLKELCLDNARENLLYIFLNQTELV